MPRGGVLLSNGTLLQSVVVRHIGDDAAGEHIIELTSVDASNGVLHGASLALNSSSALTLCVVPNSSSSSSSCLSVRNDVVGVMPTMTSMTSNITSMCESATNDVSEQSMDITVRCSAISHFNAYVSLLPRAMTTTTTNTTMLMTTVMPLVIQMQSSTVCISCCYVHCVFTCMFCVQIGLTWLWILLGVLAVCCYCCCLVFAVIWRRERREKETVRDDDCDDVVELTFMCVCRMRLIDQ